MMNIELKFKSIVWVGSLPPNLNIDRYFIVKNGFFNESEILPTSLLGENIFTLLTPKFNLSSIPIRTQIGEIVNQVALNANNPHDDNDKISEKMIAFIKAANLTNCVAGLGLNFNWVVTLQSSKESHDFGKANFYTDSIALIAKFFNNNDAEYGLYVSKDFRKSRIKLDIKPIVFKENNRTSVVDKRGFIFQFNFHCDIKDMTNNSEVLEILAEYDEYKKEAETIISIYK